MTECTRCGTETNREPLTDEAEDIDASENGVIWLCDGCRSAFDDWMQSAGEDFEVELRRLRERLKGGEGLSDIVDDGRDERTGENEE